MVALARELGRSVNGHPENVDVALPQLEAILATSADARVVRATVDALGHVSDPRAAQIILDRVRVDHRSAAVRLAVAQALPDGVNRSDACWEDVVAALIALSGDPVAEVRDWACFGLGQMEADTPAVRDAMAARLDDTHDDARCEALLTLARTGDPRARERLERCLTIESPDNIWRLELLAAGELADPALHPLLVRLSEHWEGDDDEHTTALAYAIKRCRPDATTQAEDVEPPIGMASGS